MPTAKTKSRPPKAEPQIAFLALNSTRGISDTEIIAAWEELFPSLPAITCTEKKNAFTFKIEKRAVRLLLINGPFPQHVIDDACKYSWMWDKAASKMKKQKAHFFITAANINPVQTALDISRIIAAVAKAGDPAGIYWAFADHLLEPKFFIEELQEYEDGLPVHLWVCLRISADSPKGPLTLTTLGLTVFGHKELEVIKTRRNIDDLRTLVQNLIFYLLVKGPVLKDGDTIGTSKTERMKIEFATSSFNKGEPVLRLHM